MKTRSMDGVPTPIDYEVYDAATEVQTIIRSVTKFSLRHDVRDLFIIRYTRIHTAVIRTKIKKLCVYYESSVSGWCRKNGTYVDGNVRGYNENDKDECATCCAGGGGVDVV